MQITQKKISVGFTSEILGFTIGVDLNMTGGGMVCGLDLVWWGILSSDFQVMERNHLSDPHEDLLKMYMLSYRFFLLPLTRESTTMAYSMMNKLSR